jgi:glycerol kinase
MLCQRRGLDSSKVKAIGITNQRETIVAFDRQTGQPLHNAIVWLDKRTSSIVKEYETKHNGDTNVYREVCGLPINTYFSAVKMRWLKEHSQKVKDAEAAGTLVFGTIDSWLVYVKFED